MIHGKEYIRSVFCEEFGFSPLEHIDSVAFRRFRLL